ncbi:hypothetical protein ABZP36_014343 [Zizania latifolia]
MRGLEGELRGGSCRFGGISFVLKCCCDCLMDARTGRLDGREEEGKCGGRECPGSLQQCVHGGLPQAADPHPCVLKAGVQVLVHDLHYVHEHLKKGQQKLLLFANDRANDRSLACHGANRTNLNSST